MRSVKFIGIGSIVLLSACGASDKAGIDRDSDQDTAHTAIEAEKPYYLVNVNSGLVLDVTNGSADNAAPIIQWTQNGGLSQQWRAVPGPSGAYQLVSVGSGKCLDVIGQSTDLSAGLQQYDCAGTPQNNQLWWFNAADQGAFNLVNVNSGLALDVLGQSKAMGAAVNQYSYWQGANQQWWLQAVQ